MPFAMKNVYIFENENILSIFVISNSKVFLKDF